METGNHERWANKWGVDSIMAALQHIDRISLLELFLFPNTIRKSFGNDAAAIPGTERTAARARRW